MTPSPDNNAVPRGRLIGLYLPQFHPIAENDEWWGKGFTEWTNVAKAKPLFKGHYQPHLPADLGFYDLRVPETRIAQADMARKHGIEGFCYWHYWFAGRRLLERPFNEVLKTGAPDFPFCLGWANHSWTGVWYGAPGRVLMEQSYPGIQDHEQHFRYLARAFADPRYIRVDGKPLLLIFRPKELYESRRVLDFWRELSEREGLGGLHVVAYVDNVEVDWDPIANGFDAVTIVNVLGTIFGTRPARGLQSIRRRFEYHASSLGITGAARRPMQLAPYAKICKELVIERPLPYEYYPCAVPNWDNTPRSGIRGTVLTDSTPALYREHLDAALRRVESLPASRRIVFIKSWNEWAEGNYLEPDQKFGLGYLQATLDACRSESAPATNALATAAR